MDSSIRLIVNADDLGSGTATDRGVLGAFQSGIVSSASLLANGPSFSEAAAAARDLGLPIGVHLNLSEGRPLSGPLPGLTTATGEFPGKRGLRRRLAAGAIAPEEIHRELAAQVERVLAAGLVPDHLDSHQHCILFPAVTGAVLRLAREFGIDALRLPNPAEPAAEDPPGRLGAELALYRRLAPAASRALRQAGVRTPDGLWGMPLLDRLDETALDALLRRLPPGDWELMVHPGYRDPGRHFAGKPRERELAALTSPAIRALLAEREITLIHFGDLACAS